jgi:DNA replication and repair protein RecF
MKLLRLNLEKFRNYPALDIEFDPESGITCITGPNAQGKTNILEAIYLLALTKSFRANHSEDLIMWGEDFCRVKGEFQFESAAPADAQLTLEAFYGRAPHPKKSLKKNNVKISSTDFVGNCQIVFFHPEDLNILYLGPDLRRHYIDILNIQINRKYFHALKNFKRILQQRNALLKEIKRGFAQKNQLEVWNDQLVENGSIIILERAATVRFLNGLLSENYAKISEKNEPAEVHYDCCLDKNHSGISESFESAEQIGQIYAAALSASEKEDLRSETTIVGPHRDDLRFLLNRLPLACHASRGEYRSLLLTLKLLELEFFEGKTGEKPLLLLDDVFSELDTQRQKMLLNSITSFQTIITSTHYEDALLERKHRAITDKIQMGVIAK